MNALSEVMLSPTLFSADAAVELDNFYHKADAIADVDRIAAMERELGAPKEHYVMGGGKPVNDLGWLRLLEYEFLSLRDLVDLVIV
jgi:hypothetical protein